MTNVPPKLKPMAHYVKIANEHLVRDPAVYYWAMMYTVQNAMKIDKSAPESVKFLSDCLGQLEKTKSELILIVW